MILICVKYTINLEKARFLYALERSEGSSVLAIMGVGSKETKIYSPTSNRKYFPSLEQKNIIATSKGGL